MSLWGPDLFKPLQAYGLRGFQSLIAKFFYFGYVVAHDIMVQRKHLNEPAHLMEAWKKRERGRGSGPHKHIPGDHPWASSP